MKNSQNDNLETAPMFNAHNKKEFSPVHTVGTNSPVKRNLVLLMFALFICSLFCSCSASFRLHEGIYSYSVNHGQSYYTDTITNVTMPMDIACIHGISNINIRSYYSNIELDYRQYKGGFYAKDSVNSFRIQGYIKQEKRDKWGAVRYNKCTFRNILLIVNDTDTLPWEIERASAAAFDSITRYKDKTSIDYTIDSFPWIVPTSGQNNDWKFSFVAWTEPIDIKKVRKLRLEVTFQFDNIVVTRILVAKRHFHLWLEPRQGFVWYGPEDVELSTIIL